MHSVAIHQRRLCVGVGSIALAQLVAVNWQFETAGVSLVRHKWRQIADQLLVFWSQL